MTHHKAVLQYFNWSSQPDLSPREREMLSTIFFLLDYDDQFWLHADLTQEEVDAIMSTDPITNWDDEDDWEARDFFETK